MVKYVCLTDKGKDNHLEIMELETTTLDDSFDVVYDEVNGYLTQGMVITKTALDKAIKKYLAVKK